jgi:serine/threonine protein kinase
LPFVSRIETDRGRLEFVPGTLSYLAPEVHRNGGMSISTMSDMWAVGCIGYELGMGKKLEGNRHDIDRHIIEGFLKPLDQSLVHGRFGLQVRSIIESCLQWDPTKRCTALQLQKHIEALLLWKGYSQNC